MDPSQGSAAPRRGSPGSAQLQALKRGEITLDEYLDSRVERALAGVKGYVSDEQRQVLRELLLEQLATDPVLREYVRAATGMDPGEPSAG